MSEEALQLTAQEAATLINMKFHIEAEAADGQDHSGFGIDMTINYKNMTRLQFNYYEAKILQMWREMNAFQTAVRVPEICDVAQQNVCD